MAIAPCYDFDKSTVIHQNIYRIYAFVILMCFISLYLYSTYGMFKQFQYKDLVKTEFTLELMLYGLMQFLCVFNILRSTHRRGYIWKHFLKNIQTVERNLRQGSIFISTLKLKNIDKFDSKLKSTKWFGSKLLTNDYFTMKFEVIGQVVLSLILVYNVYLWVNTNGFSYYQYYMIEVIEYTYIYTIVILSSNFAIYLKEKFKFCNRILKEFSEESVRNIFIQRTRKRKIIKRKNINNKLCIVTNLFIQLSQLVHTYSLLFGPSVLFLFGSLFIGILDSINYILVYGSTRVEEAAIYIFLNLLFLVSKY